jgi:hypothetical protein
VEPKLFFPLRLRLSESSAPEPGPATALELPVVTDFMFKGTFFMFLMKEIDLIHMLVPIQYEFRFFQNTLVDPEPGAGAETSIFRLRLQPKVSAPCGSVSGSTTLLVTRNSLRYI